MSDKELPPYLGQRRKTGGFASAGFYSNIDPGISVRPPYSRDVYESFRPNEVVPDAVTQEDYRKIMILCKMAYERVGLIRSVIDMMSEFAAEGVEIVHPDPVMDKFWKTWSSKISLEDRTERFLNWLYKSGNTVVRRQMGKIKANDLRKLDFSNAVSDVSIPIQYIFYNPSTIELVGGDIGALSNEKIYALRVPLVLKDGIRTPRNDLEKKVFKELPKEIIDALNGESGGGTYYLLPISNDKIYVSCYKKDDSDIWGKSFIYSILDDVFYNNKLKLAKLSGLDSWYNVIRLWKLGDHTKELTAPPTDYAKLASILECNAGGGSSDIIWGSDIELEEFYPPIEKLANFEENNHNILLGLGVPEGLVGGKAEGSSGMTMNYLGLKNLIKRLEAGRRAVKAWLNEEIDIIYKEMNFKNKERPIIRFSNGDLYDEKSYFELLKNLVDRNVISDRTILERINEIPEIERRRIQDEMKLRDSGKMPEKLSPLIKTPPMPGESKNGRPPGTKDSFQRKRGINRSPKAKLMIEAGKIYDEVDIFVKKHAIDVYNVNNVRELNSQQEQELDNIKITLFAHIEPFVNLTEDYLVATAKEHSGPIDDYLLNYNKLLQDTGAEKLNQEQKRMLRIEAYALTWSDGV